MHGLKLFTHRNEVDDLIELEEFGIALAKNEFLVKSKGGKNGKRTKRKRTDQSDKFPTATAVSTELMLNTVTRATCASAPKRIEKESKRNSSDDESINEQNFSSVNDLSNKESAPDFA